MEIEKKLEEATAWKQWRKENGIEGDVFPALLLVRKYEEGGEGAVRMITCPPNRRPETWKKQQEDYILLKREEAEKKEN